MFPLEVSTQEVPQSTREAHARVFRLHSYTDQTTLSVESQAVTLEPHTGYGYQVSYINTRMYFCGLRLDQNVSLKREESAAYRYLTFSFLLYETLNFHIPLRRYPGLQRWHRHNDDMLMQVIWCTHDDRTTCLSCQPIGIMLFGLGCLRRRCISRFASHGSGEPR